MIEVGTDRKESVRPGEITDGTSHTILLAECADRAVDDGGRWVSGYNCFSPANGKVNEAEGSDIRGQHPSGAYVGFADGRVEFISNSVSDFLVGAICTRSGGESTDPY